MFFFFTQFCGVAQVVIIIEKNIHPDLIIFKNESKKYLKHTFTNYDKFVESSLFFLSPNFFQKTRGICDRIFLLQNIFQTYLSALHNYL